MKKEILKQLYSASATTSSSRSLSSDSRRQRAEAEQEHSPLSSSPESPRRGDTKKKPGRKSIAPKPFSYSQDQSGTRRGSTKAKPKNTSAAATTPSSLLSPCYPALLESQFLQDERRHRHQDSVGSDSNGDSDSDHAETEQEPVILPAAAMPTRSPAQNSQDSNQSVHGGLSTTKEGETADVSGGSTFSKNCTIQ